MSAFTIRNESASGFLLNSMADASRRPASPAAIRLKVGLSGFIVDGVIIAATGVVKFKQ